MLDPAKPWEHGSDFYLPEFPPGGDPALPPNADFYGSGRDAIRALLNHGVSELGWRVLWIPTYFCQTVVRDMRTEGLEIRTYGDSPLDSVDDPIVIEDRRPGAVLYLNPFGLRARRRPLEFDRDALALIEDHTHDPWSPTIEGTDADYGVASLRKTIPIPDGGLLWSPVGKTLPFCPGVTAVRETSSLRKLAGMTLKRLYLAGDEPEKSLMRRFLVSGEEGIADGPISGMPFHSRLLLDAFPARKWQTARKQNFWRLAKNLDGLGRVRVLLPEGEGPTPFVLVLVAEESSLRDEIRAALIQANVYPAVLWTLSHPEVEGLRPLDLMLSETMLALHCDARYAEADLDRVADIVASVVSALP